MAESGYYPLGADNSNAPWNESTIPKKSFDICISQTLSKSTEVITDDYCLERDGSYLVTNTSDTDWSTVYAKNHCTPIMLIGLFKEFLEKHLPDPIVDIIGYKKAKKLMSECEGWIDDETEIMEE